MKTIWKKLFSIFSVGCLILTSMVLSPRSGDIYRSIFAFGADIVTNYKLGDVNQDNVVSVEDAQMSLIEYVSVMSGMESSLTNEQFSLADVNADKSISVEDAQYILIYYVSNTLSGEMKTWDQILHPEPATSTMPTTTTSLSTTTTIITTTTAKPTTAISTTKTTAATTIATTAATTVIVVPPTQSNPQNYVLNTNTKKFHYPSCSSANKISAKNRSEAYCSREELIAQGYSPCGNCHP